MENSPHTKVLAAIIAFCFSYFSFHKKKHSFTTMVDILTQIYVFACTNPGHSNTHNYVCARANPLHIVYCNFGSEISNF